MKIISKIKFTFMLSICMLIKLKFSMPVILIVVLSSDISAQNYKLVWSEEFTGRYLNENIWTRETGGNGWGNEEIQYYTDRDTNAYVEDGKLIIQALEESFGGKNYTSARLITENRKFFKYGRIEARIKLPTGKGLWPAFWMLGQNFSSVGWPQCGEIDIMEMIGGSGEENKVYGTAHWDNNGQHASYGGIYSLPDGKFPDDFHLFAVEWNSQSIKWFVDGNQYNVIDITPQDLNEFQNNFFIILNIAVGGTWPGEPDNSTVFPQKMEIDYIRVYQDASYIPDISISNPGNNTIYNEFEDIEISANINYSGEIKRVEFYQGDMQIGESTFSPFNMIWRNVYPGNYKISAKAISTDGYIGTSSSITVAVGENNGLVPYSGEPIKIPGKFEAENYDIGGTNISFKDNTAQNLGFSYRKGDAVDIEACLDDSKGFNIGWAEADEWLIYTIEVEETGEYEMTARVASEADDASFQFEINDTSVTEVISIPNSGDWQNWINVISVIELKKGIHHLKFKVLSGEFNVNRFEVYKPGAEPMIRLISPNGGESLNIGSIYDIRWNQLKVDNVSIGLSTDGGSNWSFVAKDIPSLFGFYRWKIPDIRSDNCKIMIIDANLASINDMSDSTFIIDLINSVDEFKSSSQHFVLFQNYPNPFNPSTKIKYRIKNNSKVLLEIFNINGEKISTLVDSEQQIGIHEAIWYGKDDNNHSVPSGFYIYKIKVNNSVRAGKMVLIK